MPIPEDPEKRKLWQQRQSESHRDQIAWNKGKHRTEKTKEKISEFHKGHSVSKKTRKKISESEKGKHISKKTRLKMSESHLGEKNCNWRGGVSSLSQIIRKCATYKLWQKAVFIRDHFQCQDCGKIGGDLHAHHTYLFHKLIEDLGIQSLGQAIRTEELWDISLGTTLCIKCHKKRHRRNQTHEKIKNLINSGYTTRGHKISTSDKRITKISRTV